MRRLTLFILLLAGLSMAAAETPRFTLPITNFNAGQVSPWLEARQDFERYTSACRTLENMHVSVLGPAFKRPGTKYIATAKSGTPRLIAFKYSQDDSYVIEVGDEYMRFYRNGGQIMSGASPYEIATCFQPSELSSIQYARADNSLYIVDGNDAPQILTRSGHASWTIADVSFTKGPFRTENSSATTMTPSGTTGSITLTASAATFDTGHIGSIWRISHDAEGSKTYSLMSANGSTSAVKVGSDWEAESFGNAFTGDLTVERSEDNVTWESAGAFISSLTPNYENDLNHTGTEDSFYYYRITLSNYAAGTTRCTFVSYPYTHHGYVTITAVNSTTEAEGTVTTELYSTDATTTWSEGAWSDYRGHPRTVAFHQQRLIFGGSVSHPTLLWFSETGPDNYTDFEEGSEATDAFTVAIQGQDDIQWLTSRTYLIVGTSGSVGIYGEPSEPISPDTPAYREETPHGAASIPAVRAADAILYVERGDHIVRELSYNLQYDKYVSPDATILAENITDSGIAEMDFQLRPDPRIWCVLNNGEIATLTYQRSQSVMAWSKQTTPGLFKSVVTVPGISGGEDEVWFTVGRLFSANLLLHFDGADGDQFTEDAMGRHPRIDFYGTAQIDTAAQKYGAGSLLLDGDSDFITLPDSDDWDVFEDDGNYTIEFWVKHDDHAGIETYIAQNEDNNNSWFLAHYHGSGIAFRLFTAGSAVVTLADADSEITDTDWHHVAICKVGTEYGTYLDGTQVAYVDDDSTDTLDGPLHIGFYGSGSSNYFDGAMDEIRMEPSNVFSAAPDEGKTDTITPPAAQVLGYTTYIEQLQPQDWGDEQEDAWFVDSGLNYLGVATDSFSGLDHLIGETVSVYADGVILSDETVDGSGEITIDVEAEEVIVGLPYTAKLETLPLMVGLEDQASNKKISAVYFDFIDTGYCEYGNGADSDLTVANFSDEPSITPLYDLHTSTVTYKKFTFPYGSMRKQTIYIESDRPMPLGIRAIIPELSMTR